MTGPKPAAAVDEAPEATRHPTFLRRLVRGPVSRTATAMFAMAVAVIAVLVARLIAAGGMPQFLGQDVDPPAAGLVLASLLFGLWLARRPLPVRIPDATTRGLLLVALAVFGLLAIGAIVVFGTSPATPDEQVALWQARLFSQFQIIGRYPTGLVDHMLLPTYQNTIILVGSDGRAISVYWPGWAILMTPFVWLGVPWLLGPATAGLSVFLTGKIAIMLGGARAATIAGMSCSLRSRNTCLPSLIRVSANARPPP